MATASKICEGMTPPFDVQKDITVGYGDSTVGVTIEERGRIAPTAPDGPPQQCAKNILVTKVKDLPLGTDRVMNCHLCRRPCYVTKI